MTVHNSFNADVIVVGAGLSGLTAAKQLTDSGLNVLVLEGKSRVGGRTWSDARHPGGSIDFGGMFIGTTHERSTLLGQSLGLKMVQARPAGKMVWNLGDEVLIAEDGGYPEKNLNSGQSLKDSLTEAFKAVDRVAAQVGKDAPWDAPDAKELDGMTVSTWLERNIEDPLVRKIVGSDVAIITGADPSEVSMLFFAFYVAQCENMYALQVTSNTSLWLGGAQQISVRLAETMGSAVHLNEHVVAISYSEEGVEVTTTKATYSARRAILAMPPMSDAQIHFSPELPHSRRQINRRTNLGRYFKIHFRYNKRFWVEKGLSGEIFSLKPNFFSLDVTREGDELATLVLFVGGSSFDVLEAAGSQKRKEILLEALVSSLGEDARNLADYVEINWNDQPFTMGGPVCHMPPGLLSSAGPALRASIGPIHFAGTEAAPAWTGYMEGAVRSGETAAEAVIKEIK